VGAFEDYLGLVGRLSSGEINRSENDLSSNLKDALASFGLHGVIDTGSGSNRIKRPDIALYVDLAAADVSSSADVILESKKPEEVARFQGLSEALADDELWNDKFVPYVRAHADLASYFILTTFERFLILPISAQLRLGVQSDGNFPDRRSRLTLLASATTFDLRQPGGGVAFEVWCAGHLTLAALTPPPLSSILDIKTLSGPDALEDFASALADVVVGPEGYPIEPAEWVFHSERFDRVPSDQLPLSFFAALGRLVEVDNPAIRDLAATGRFYDWLAPRVDPSAFRRLVSLFFAHNFGNLDGDLLGRFFEFYAQRIDRRRRKQLGQYYTPLPIVRHRRLSLDIARERDVVHELVVLDPGVGSGTFLIEGAGRLQGAGIHRFWERLSGFDISAQAICIAQVNLYVAVLAHLDRNEAEAVGMLRLYPTDALDPRNGAKLRGILPLLTDATTRAFLLQRIELSEALKQQAHFPLVIGNPPYRNNSDQTLAQVAERFPRLLRSSRDNARARKRNIRDDYAWFFAAADHYVADRGIIAFVVSDSFCYASSYRFFREDLLRRYRVRHLVNLGALVFRDVGPRTQFVIIILERRDVDLIRADDCEPVQYVNLRPLISESGPVQGGSDDPRLVALDANLLPPPQEHLPVRQRSFALYPAADVVTRVDACPVVLHGDNPRRIFVKKWPGLITAFDELFKGRTRDELSDKMTRFFAASELSESQREGALDELAPTIRATSAKNRGRLSLMARQASDSGLRFEAARSLSG
jgi:methylase of polypeptide subunit release factors